MAKEDRNEIPVVRIAARPELASERWGRRVRAAMVVFCVVVLAWVSWGCWQGW